MDIHFFLPWSCNNIILGFNDGIWIASMRRLPERFFKIIGVAVWKRGDLA